MGHDFSVLKPREKYDALFFGPITIGKSIARHNWETQSYHMMCLPKLTIVLNFQVPKCLADDCKSIFVAQWSSFSYFTTSSTALVWFLLNP